MLGFALKDKRIAIYTDSQQNMVEKLFVEPQDATEDGVEFHIPLVLSQELLQPTISQHYVTETAYFFLFFYFWEGSIKLT